MNYFPRNLRTSVPSCFKYIFEKFISILPLIYRKKFFWLGVNTAYVSHKVLRKVCLYIFIDILNIKQK